MKKIVRFLRPAELEMLDAARYYELQAQSLGKDFFDKIDQAIADIANDPQKWPIIRFQIRRRLLIVFLSAFYIESIRTKFSKLPPCISTDIRTTGLIDNLLIA
jgi:hypothetical protein